MMINVFTIGLAFAAGICAGVSGLTLLLYRFDEETDPERWVDEHD